jgi:hypothetical protein
VQLPLTTIQAAAFAAGQRQRRLPLLLLSLLLLDGLAKKE